MSDFTVVRSLDGYCLVLDKKRIAGGKPDYRGENVLVDWTTEVAYGPVDDLAAENAKLRELVRDMWGCISHIGEYDVFYYDMAKDGCGISCTVNGEHCCADKLHDRMCELGIEVDE